MGEEEKKEEIVLRVLMHCEGCATKVRRCLIGFEGVEQVTADMRRSEVVVKGEKADPLKVLERVQRKISHRKVELISPIPQNKPPETETTEEKVEPEPDPEPEKEKEPEPEKEKEPDVHDDDDKKIEQPPPAPAVISMVLGVYMHSDACAQEIKWRIQRMEGVESAEADVKSLEVNVKGVFEPQTLIDYVYKSTGKHAVTIKVGAEKAKQVEEEKKDKEEAENKEGGGGGGAASSSSSSSGGGGGGEPDTEEPKLLELRKIEFHHDNYQHNNYYQMYPAVQEMNNAYPSQIFSDENPNACSIM